MLVAALVLFAPGGAAAQDDDAPDLAFLARSDDPADALAAGAVAGAFTAPLLVTPPDALAAPVAEALQALDPELVIVVGGVDALAEQVEADVQALGLDTRRVFGADRVETAIAVSALLEEFSPPGGPPGPAGADGAQGPAGADGPSGAPGADGAQGPTGPVGATGDTGAVGATGDTGAVGPRATPARSGRTGRHRRRSARPVPTAWRVPLAPPVPTVPPVRPATRGLRAPPRSSPTAPVRRWSRPPSPAACQGTVAAIGFGNSTNGISVTGRLHRRDVDPEHGVLDAPGRHRHQRVGVLQPHERAGPDRHDRRRPRCSSTSPRPPTTPSPRCRGRSSL